MLVTAINRTDDLVLLGDRYLFPGEGRRVPVNVYREARDRYGAGLVAHGELGAPDATIPVDDDGAPDEFSLDVFDGEAADLGRLTRPELVEAARRSNALTPQDERFLSDFGLQRTSGKREQLL